MRTFLRRVSERVVEALLANPARLRKVLFPSSTETVIDDEVLVAIEGLSYYESELSPTARITQLGKVLGDVDGVSARGFSSAEVRKIATAFALLTVDGLDRALRQIPLPAESPSIKELLESFTVLKDFVTDSAKAEAGMIIYAS